MRKFLNIGINDAGYKVQKFEVADGKNTQVWICPFYQRWASMLKRCYSENVHSKQPCYIGCSVCEEWLTFSNFKRWMERQDWQGNDLDKDLINEGNKVYSPDNCAFVSKTTNRFVTDRKNKRGEYKIGVSYYPRYGKFASAIQNPITGKSENLGYFQTEDEAHKAWRIRKNYFAFQLADLQPDARVANALRLRYAS